MRRKLFACTVSLIAGIACGYLEHRIAAAGAMAVLGWLCLNKRIERQRRVFAVAIIVSFLCGAFFFYGESQIFTYGERYDTAHTREMILQVREVERVDKEKYRMVCRILELDGKRLPRYAPQKVMVSCYSSIRDPWGLYGKALCVTAPLAAPEPPGNPRTFDYALYLKTRGISHTATVYRYTVEDPRQGPGDVLKTKILRIRDRFLYSLHCDEPTRALLAGILFGETHQLEEETYDTFRSNGTAHVLAVSGLHIGILYALYKRLFGSRRNWRTVLLLLGVLGFYGTITLWAVSVTRAILLIILVMIGDMTDRRYDILTALAVVALAVILRQPYVVFGAGFQMSFLAVTSMAFFAPYLLRKMPLWVPDSVPGILAIQMGMIPYTAYVFNYVPLLAVLCNLPVVYMLSLIVPVGLVALGLSLVVGSAGPAGTLLVSFASMLSDLNEALAMQGRFSCDVQSTPFGVLIMVYGILFLVTSEAWYVMKSRDRKEPLRRLICLILVVGALLVLQGRTPMDKASLVFVDVGQGDCLHIRAGSSVDLLIDGGGKEDYDVGKKVLKPYLLKNGAGDVDLAMATHLHTDHYKGLEELCACYPVRRLMTSGQAGEVIRVSRRCTIRLLWPLERDPTTEDENVNSLIFRVEIDGVSALVTGDITEEGEKAMLEYYRGTDLLDCDILKVAHHGSKYSSSSEFLAAVSPKIAVISVGRNTYGHPTPEAIARLKECGAQVYRTDRMGAVGVITSDGEMKVCWNRSRVVS